MGLLDKFKNFIGGDDMIDDDFEEYDRPGEPDMPAEKPVHRETSRRSPESDRQFNINATAQLQVILVKPEVFADTRMIADHINDKKTVVLNLESTSPDIQRRIIDFIGGVAYAHGGNIKPVANNTFIIFPYNVNFVGEDLAAELESNGVVF